MPRRRLTAVALAALLVVGQGSTSVRPVVAGRVGTPFGPGPRTVVPVVPAASGLPAPKGTTRLISQNLNGQFPSGPSVEASMSESGRFVAFSSLAADLVADDTNSAQDVFVLDRRGNGPPTILPLPGGGPVPVRGRAFDPSISADGNVVAFTYQAPSDLLVVPSIVVAWDRRTGKTTYVARRADKTVATNTREPSVSADGHLIAFTSGADDIVNNDNNEASDVFVINRTTGKTTLVSLGTAGTSGDLASDRPSISADGTVVSFDSQSTDLVPIAGAPQAKQVYVRNLAAGTTELISVNASGGYGAGASQASAASADGHAIAFESGASDLVPGDTANSDVFVRDRTAATTTLVSINLDGGPANAASGQAAIAADGRIVAFTTQATNLVASTGPGIMLAASILGTEVMARDLVLGDTIRISEAVGGGPGFGQSVGPAIGGDGRYVGFTSSSPKLVDGDGNQLADVFLRDLPPDPLVTPAVLDFGTLAIGQPGLPLAAIVSNRGWGPLSLATATRSGPAAADFAVLANGCKGARIHRTEVCTVSLGFTATAKGSRTATLALPGDYAGPTRTVRLVGIGSKAVLKLDPAVSVPGMVTVVTGTGFPAGATITLAWSIGITPQLAKIVTAADGSFKIGVLIFHHDVIGPRTLTATRVAGPLFPPAEGAMLVVSGTDVPSTYGWQLQPPYGPPLVVRR